MSFRPTEGYIDNSANVDVQDAPQKRPSGPGIPTFAGNGDIRVIGYLPSEQELALGHTGTGVSFGRFLLRHILTRSPTGICGNHEHPPKCLTS